MNYPEWVPFVTVGLGAVITIFNGMFAFSLRTVVSRLEKLEADRESIWAQISTMRVDAARDGATRGDIDKIHVHLQNQDKQLVAMSTLLARLVPQASSQGTANFGVGS